MKAAVVALACILRLAVPAQADEATRPPAPDAAQANPAEPPPQLRPWVDPGSAQVVGHQPAPAAPAPAAPTNAKVETDPHEPTRAKRETPPARDAQRQRQCLGAVETRQTVAAHRLTEPFQALRAGRQQGEALRAKLCHWKQDQFVYEVFVLRRDGRIVRVYMNAQNGQSVGALDDDPH